MDFALALGLALLLNTAVFVIAYIRQTDKLTDVTYATTFVLIGAVLYLMCADSPVSLTILAMVSLWAVRLGLFLAIRIHRMGRDKRFDAIRSSFLRFGSFWLLQGLSVWAIMIPAIFILSEMPANFSTWSYAGLGIWIVGLFLESIADRQKSLFLSKPANKGKWLETGLWAYSRHPNYLGEILVWLGIYLFAVPYLAGWEIAAAAVSPLWIAILLIFVTGIPKAEQSADARWGKLPAYRAYKKRVPALLPKKLF